MIRAVRVGIDPGHGGRDKGTCGDLMIESAYNLRVCQDLQYHLAKAGDVRPLILRQHDVKMELSARAEVAAKMDCDVVISVHVNAGPPQLHGALGFHREDDRLGEAVSNAVLRAMPIPLLRYGGSSFEAVDSDDDGKRWLQRPYNVLEHYTVPACLIELGYRTHKADLDALLSAATRRCIVVALTAGVCRFLQILEGVPTPR